MKKIAVVTPQYPLQGNQLCSGRVAGSPFDFAECAGADGDALQLQLCHQVHVPQVFLFPQAADVKADDGGAALSDPFCFGHGATSKADPGQAKEILPFVQELLLQLFQ